MQTFINNIRRILRYMRFVVYKIIKAITTPIVAISQKVWSILTYMGQETKKHLPEWKEDVEDYKQEQKERISRYRRFISLEWLDWKKTFVNVDASPEKLHQMLFEDKTKIGRRFEQLLIVLILGSLVVVLLDSVVEIHAKIGLFLKILEWGFTIIFTIEYLLRIYSSPRPVHYVTSFFGIIDLITVLPTYIAIIFTQAHTFLILRVLRVFRVFRLLKLVKMMRAGAVIQAALIASRAKIIVFFIFVLLMVTLMGSVLYIVEAGEGSGFTSIPNSIYWAIVTLTTVGYGDITPDTWLGKMIAAGIMIIGYSIIAVPTGIVSAEFVNESKNTETNKVECHRCGKENHEQGARYCNRCAENLIVNEANGEQAVPA